ncbi:MAG: alpha/beta fold hydrolase [Vicinamibacteria bacterium]
MTRVRKLRLGLGAMAVASLIGVNILAYGHAWTMTHFVPGGVRTGGPESLTWLQKLSVVAMGVQIPKPRNEGTPLDRNMAFETWTVPVEEGITLEAWDIPNPKRRGFVVMFHGYADRKSSILAEAKGFLDEGWEPVLVDLRGSGGSSGNTTSIGFHEGRDERAAVRFVREKAPNETLVLWGVSMGGAAALRAVGELGAKVDAMIVEAPFATLRSAVVNRFTSLGVPSVGLVDLLIFWGGRQLDFDGSRFNPVEYAKDVRAPTLVLLGDQDNRVLMPEGRAIFEALAGEKQFETFPGLRHESLIRGNRSQWLRVVHGFLNRFPEKPSPVAVARTQ